MAALISSAFFRRWYRQNSLRDVTQAARRGATQIRNANDEEGAEGKVDARHDVSCTGDQYNQAINALQAAAC